MPTPTANPIQQYTIPDQLDAHWTEFVDCRQRLETMAPFLSSQVRAGDYYSVLDAAMGIGCEVDFLMDSCSRVVGNEINRSLLGSAVERLKHRAIQPEITHVLWQELGSCFTLGEFDLALLLGNSFCLVPDLEARQKIACAFRKIVRKGGAVIVDERNFDYILNERTRILRSGFRYCHRVVYCGVGIEGYPVSIEDSEVIFEYRTMKKQEVLGLRTMFPLAPGELSRLFIASGFEQEVEYSDLQLGHKREADFFTHVFK